jgi:hypothetical protein
MSALDTLTQKLEEFIKKYYINELLKGAIYAVGLTILFFLSVLILQYFGGFNTTGRAVLFYSFISAAIFVLFNNILMPISRMFNLTKRMSYEEAAQIVGKSFDDINDKILNTLQLCKNNAMINKNQLDLITASIQQRISQLKPIPFTSAIKLSDNKRHLRFLAVPVFLFLGIFVYNKDIITDGTDSLLNYNKEIEVEMPFEFEIVNDELSVLQQEDFELKVKINEKKFVPEEAYIVIDGKSHKLKKINKKEFSYTFRNVQKNQTFYLKSQEVQSTDFELATVPKPSLLSFDLAVDYPCLHWLERRSAEKFRRYCYPRRHKVKMGF